MEDERPGDVGKHARDSFGGGYCSALGLRKRAVTRLGDQGVR